MGTDTFIFERLTHEQVMPLVRNINPIPFSREYQEFCRTRYATTAMYVGGRLRDRLIFVMPVFLYAAGSMRIAEIPFSNYFSEFIFFGSDYILDLATIRRPLLKFLDVDIIRFNVIDYHKRLKPSDAEVNFVAISLDIAQYTSAEDLLIRAVTLRRRNQIKFSAKQGFRTALLSGDNLESVYALYRAHHIERKYSIRGIEELRNILIAFGDKAKIIAAYKDENMIAAIIFVLYVDHLWMIINISDYEYSYYQINNYIYWEVIKYGFEHGAKYIDFGGTPVDDKGNIHFKKQYGVQIEPIYSSVYFRNAVTHIRYWLQRRIWHLALRWRIIKRRLTKNRL